MSERTAAESSSPRATRIPSLDGFRAISIMLVFISHLEYCVGFPSSSRNIGVDFGLLGVRVFFVISGFLITTLLLKEERNRRVISLSAFYKRRVLRILPTFYIYLLVAFILGQFMPSLKCSLSDYATAATFTTGLAGHWGLALPTKQTWLLSHAWSLAVEEQFYVFWPALLILVRPGLGYRRFVVGFIIGFALLMRILFARSGFIWVIMTDHLFLTQADSIMFGCLLALVWESNRPMTDRIFGFHPPLGRAMAGALVLGVQVLPMIFVHLLHHQVVALTVSIQAAAIAYLIGSYISVKSGISYQILNHPWLQWIGVLSYSLYIWQQPFLAPYDIRPNHWWQAFPQNVALAFGCAVISYYWIETPFLALKSHFSRLETAGSAVPERTAG